MSLHNAQLQVVIGDHEGIVQVFSVAKNQEIAHTFKTLPGQPISRIELGGALGTVKDKIFAGELRFWVRHIQTSFEISYILELSVNEVDPTSGDFLNRDGYGSFNQLSYLSARENRERGRSS